MTEENFECNPEAVTIEDVGVSLRMVGKWVRKRSRKPFKNGFRAVEAGPIVVNPNGGKPAFHLGQDNVVDCGQCEEADWGKVRDPQEGERFWVVFLRDGLAEVRNVCMNGLTVGDVIRVDHSGGSEVVPTFDGRDESIVHKRGYVFAVRYEPVTRVAFASLCKAVDDGADYHVEGAVPGIAFVSGPDAESIKERLQGVNDVRCELVIC